MFKTLFFCLFLLNVSALFAQDSLRFVIRVDDITSRTTSTQYMPRGILPFQDMVESHGARVSWAVMPARLLEPNVNTGGELGRELRTTASRGHEIVLHGYDHICNLDGSSGHEMYHPDHMANFGRNFTYAEQAKTITDGLKLLADSVNGVRPTSFVPPGHFSDATTHQVLTDQGFRAIGISLTPQSITSTLYNIGTSEDFAWALTETTYASKRTETLRDIRAKASRGHYTLLLHDPFTRPGYLNGMTIRWTSEILDSVKAEYGSKLKFVTIAQLAATLTAQATSIDAPIAELASGIELMPNVPNPFNPTTVIRFTLDGRRQIGLAVYDLMGRKLTVLADGFYPAGEHSVRFDASTLPSGVYLYRLESNGTVLTRKMVLLK
jgi:predicted deacetylase